MSDEFSEKEGGFTVRPKSRRELLTKVIWVAPAIVATATVSARAQDTSPGCSPVNPPGDGDGPPF
jgi:hypothetical protein